MLHDAASSDMSARPTPLSDALDAADAWVRERLSLVPSSERAAEKQASRDEDARALAAGEKTQDHLRRENGVFSQFRSRPDFAGAYRRR